jgi:hypothetical protein
MLFTRKNSCLCYAIISWACSCAYIKFGCNEGCADSTVVFMKVRRENGFPDIYIAGTAITKEKEKNK